MIFIIVITISSVQRPQVLGMHIDLAKPEARTKADSNAPNVCSRILSSQNDSFHDIACLKAEVSPLALFVLPGKAMVGNAHLPAPVSGCPHLQRAYTFDDQGFRRACAHIGCIAPVRLGQSSGGTVSLGPATGANLDGQSCGFETLVERPARCIDSGGIPERGPRLG